jgi:hypothetical protein
MTEKLTHTDLVEHRLQLEKDLSALVYDRLIEFAKLTGFTVKRVGVVIAEIHSDKGYEGRYVFGGVRVCLDL